MQTKIKTVSRAVYIKRRCNLSKKWFSYPLPTHTKKWWFLWDEIYQQYYPRIHNFQMFACSHIFHNSLDVSLRGSNTRFNFSSEAMTKARKVLMHACIFTQPPSSEEERTDVSKFLRMQMPPPGVRYHLRILESRRPDFGALGPSKGASKVPIARPGLWPVFEDPRWQHPRSRPSQGLSKRPPDSQQDRKNSQVAPDMHSSSEPDSHLLFVLAEADTSTYGKLVSCQLVSGQLVPGQLVPGQLVPSHLSCVDTYPGIVFQTISLLPTQIQGISLHIRNIH